MSYSRILKPRFFVNSPTWLFSRGLATSKWSKIQGTYNNTPSDIELMDGNVSNRVSFDTSGNTTTHIIFQMDFSLTSAMPIDYVAILNHNLSSAEGKIRIAYKTTAFTGAGQGTVVSNVTNIVNGSESLNIVQPTNDGSTVFTFDEVNDKRYWAIEIVDDANFSATDLEMGLVQIGEWFSPEHSPDLQVKRSFMQDGIDVTESLGGKRYATARWVRGSSSTDSSFGQPFRNPYASYLRRPSGRMGYDLKFSYINDTDLLSSDLEDITAGDTTLGDVWMKTCGRLHPFIFTADNTSTVDGDYLWARFAQNELTTSQVANRLWEYSLSIEEEF